MSSEHPTQYPETSQAVLALVLGIVSLILCQILAPVAWSIGNTELRAIEAGRRPPENRSLANVGRILGIIGTVLLGIAIVVFVIVILAGTFVFNSG